MRNNVTESHHTSIADNKPHGWFLQYSAPSNFACSNLQYANFATETNLHLCKPRYSKMVIQIDFLMDNDNVYVFLHFFIL